MKIISFILIFILFIILGCRGMPSEKTPIHLNPNMDNQARFDVVFLFK